MNTVANDVAEKLELAASLVERGWTRGQACKDGRVCAIGAINEAFCGDPERYQWPRGRREASTFLIEVIGTEWIAGWNDKQKSKRAVVDAFKRAAELARGGAA